MMPGLGAAAEPDSGADLLRAHTTGFRADPTALVAADFARAARLRAAGGAQIVRAVADLLRAETAWTGADTAAFVAADLADRANGGPTGYAHVVRMVTNLLRTEASRLRTDSTAFVTADLADLAGSRTTGRTEVVWFLADLLRTEAPWLGADTATLVAAHLPRRTARWTAFLTQLVRILADLLRTESVRRRTDAATFIATNFTCRTRSRPTWTTASVADLGLVRTAVAERFTSVITPATVLRKTIAGAGTGMQLIRFAATLIGPALLASRRLVTGSTAVTACRQCAQECNARQVEKSLHLFILGRGSRPLLRDRPGACPHRQRRAGRQRGTMCMVR
jgi:hypothetical protein